MNENIYRVGLDLCRNERRDNVGFLAGPKQLLMNNQLHWTHCTNYYE